MAISLNPGFLLLIAAALALVSPERARLTAMAAAALAAIWLVFAPPFGEPVLLRQIGLSLSPVRLDEAGQLFGFAAGVSALLAVIAAHARRDRLEDVALMLLAGGAVSAAFAGDLVTFIAAASTASVGGAGLLIAGRSPEARAAAVRYLGWHALAGFFMVAAVGLVWAESGDVRLQPLAPGGPAGFCLLVGLLVSAGAPLAHVWLRDAMAHAGTTGAALIAAVAFIPAHVGMARVFAGADALIWIGAVMALAPLPLAFAEPHWRRAAGLGFVSQSGLVVAAIGLATPAALAGAASMAFAGALGAMLVALALGVAQDMLGADRATGPGFALWRVSPMLAGLAAIGAASLLSVPGTAGYAARSMFLEAFLRSDTFGYWALFAGVTALAVTHGGLRAPLSAFAGPKAPNVQAPAAFPAMLAAGLAAFMIFAAGVAPEWLYGLAPPTPAAHDPFVLSRLVPHVELIAAAACVYLALASTPLAPSMKPAEILDLDWALRRPLREGAARAGAWLGARYAQFSLAQDKLAAAAQRRLGQFAARLDRPSRPAGVGAALAAAFASAVILVFMGLALQTPR